jgi:hypothetical protein
MLGLNLGDISTLEISVGFVVGFLAALMGAIAYEPLKATWGAMSAKRPPLRRWYWQITYHPDDRDWTRMWSVELVEVFVRGRKVWGTMYRVNPGNFQRRWQFEGMLHGRRHLSLVYHSTGDDYGANGTVDLGVLDRWLWCGTFHMVPEVARGIELMGESLNKGLLPRIGPDFSEESRIEWLAADSDPNDPVRGYLASIGADHPASPALAAKYLPPKAREVLLGTPPFSSWFWRGAQYAASQVSLEGVYAAELARRGVKPEPRKWESPTRRVLGLGEDPDEETA